jgi:hypothetical protein
MAILLLVNQDMVYLNLVDVLYTTHAHGGSLVWKKIADDERFLFNMLLVSQAMLYFENG